MNRRIAAWVVAGVVALGLAACSGGSDEPEEPADAAPAAPAEPAAEEPAEPEAEEPEETEEPAEEEEQSVAVACTSMAGPMAEASEKMQELNSDPAGDPQDAVDTWTALVDAFESISETVTNSEVSAAAAAVHEDLAELRDQIQKVYVDEDMGAMTDYMTAATEWQASYTALIELCAP